jgi:hypothetical protein
VEPEARQGFFAPGLRRDGNVPPNGSSAKKYYHGSSNETILRLFAVEAFLGE